MAKKVRRLTRDHISIPQDTGESVADLGRKVKGTKPTQATSRRTQGVPRERIRVAENVFQWRTDARHLDHILKMAKGLLDIGEALDPITVLPVGKLLYVVDGHHRLDAYDTARWRKRIPATVLPGTLQEARAYALTHNSKDKANFTDRDRYEAAWRMTQEWFFDGAKYSIPYTAKATTVATSTVSNMRRTLKVLVQTYQAKEEKFPRDMRWRRARMEEQGQPIQYDDNWLEAEAQKLVDAARKANINFAKNPEITAMALRLLHDNMPRALISEWFVEEREFIEQLMEERSEPLPF